MHHCFNYGTYPSRAFSLIVEHIHSQDARHLGNVKTAALATLNDMMTASRDQQGPHGAPPPISTPSAAARGGAAPPPIELLEQVLLSNAS